MSRKAWFGYTATSIEGKPAPCIWYDELPNVKNYLNPTIVGTPVDVSRYISVYTDEVYVSFKYLENLFPPPEYTPPAKIPLEFINILDSIGVTMGVFTSEDVK